MTFDEIAENFELLDEWEDRYRYLIELGRQIERLPDALKTDTTKVRGCASQVWLVTRTQTEATGQVRLQFSGESEAHIVQGLIAVLLAIHSGKTPNEILATDTLALFDSLGLREHLTPQRSNGLAAMAARIRTDAEAAIADGP